MADLNIYWCFVLIFYASWHLGPALGQSTSNDALSCPSLCKTTFQVQEQESCIRGCQFIAVLGTIHNLDLSEDQMKDACFGVCDGEYKTSNASSCAFGCQSQIPSVDNSQENGFEVIVLVDDNCFPSMLKRFADYSNHIINSTFNQLYHQLSVGWKFMTSYSMYEDRNGAIVVQQSPDNDIPLMSENTQGKSDVSISEFHRNLISYLQNVKQTGPFRLERSDVSPQLLDSTAIVVKYSCDWLSCLSASTNLSKSTILFLFCILIAATLCVLFDVSLVLFSDDKNSTDVPKLSIYGDQESLPSCEEKLLESACEKKEKKLEDPGSSTIPAEILI